jgi:hypothetical protein
MMEAFKTNVNAIPKLGFSTFRMPGGGCQPVVESAVAAGDHHVVAAEMYENEATVGTAIAAPDVPWNDLFVTSKSMVMATVLWTLTEPRDQRTERAVRPLQWRLDTERGVQYLIHVRFVHYWTRAMSVTNVAILKAGQAAGHVRPDIDPTTALDQIYGPICLILLVGHAPPTDDLAATLVGTMLPGVLVAPRKPPSNKHDSATAKRLSRARP